MPERFTPEELYNPETAELKLFKESTAYINAGGRGTRLESILPKTDTGITKALIDFGDKPIIDYHVERLLNLGFNHVIVGTGDHTDLQDHYQQKEGLDSRLLITTTSMQEGTGGDLIKSLRENSIDSKYIVVQNCDTLIDVEEAKVLQQHKDTQAVATIVISTRSDAPNHGAYVIGRNNKVVLNKEASSEFAVDQNETHGEDIEYEGSSTGMAILDKDVLINYPWVAGDSSLSLYSEVLGDLAQQGKLWAYNNGEHFFIDIGTPNSYQKISRHPILKNILKHRAVKK